MKLTAREVLIVLAAVVVLFVGWTRHERAIGAQRILTHQADSIAIVMAKQQVAAHDSAVQARASADSMVAMARKEKANDAKREAAHDSTIRETANARADAERLLLDSAASLASVRAQLAQIVASSRADSIAAAAERQQHERTVLALTQALASDSTAIQRGIAAENAALASLTASQTQVKLLRSAQLSTFGNIVRGGVLLAAGVGLGHLLR